MTGIGWSRSPMDPSAVQALLRGPGDWRVRHVLSTTSTHDDLAALHDEPGGCAGLVLVTEEQTAGRGRSGRQWSCPAGAGLMFSAAVDAGGIPVGRRPWMGVALGLSVVHAFDAVAGVRAQLKWPNDIQVSGRKCGGILAEALDDVVLVGTGLNISLRESELPRPDATSLLLAGAGDVDRNALLAAVLDEFGALLGRWRAAGGDVDRGGLRPAYLAACSTIGAAVRVELPGGASVRGVARAVDADGALEVDSGGRRQRFSAGDVVHLRPDGVPAGDQVRL